MTWQSEVSNLKSVLIKDPIEAYVSQEKIDKEWQSLNYLEKPDFELALEEYGYFEKVFLENGVKINKLKSADSLDSLYARDASISTNGGMIICNMGKPERNHEPRVQAEFYQNHGIKIKGFIEPPGTLEGGDVAWIDESTIAVARGYRTNDEGIRQLRELVKDVVDEVIVFHSPHYRGPSDVFHLMSVFSPIDHDLAVVYSPLMPVSFRELLRSRGTKLIEVPEEEFDSLGCNVLAIKPRLAIMCQGNPVTKKRLQNAGAEVLEYCGNEISLKGCGGPTCLTRPLERA